ncbi:hypothetical protein ID866_5638 [Astraeus odoratus]|nr:hypothetical protein ID866_5638 [Astraeus odoratus]
MPKIILKPRLARGGSVTAAPSRTTRAPAVPTPPPPRHTADDTEEDDDGPGDVDMDEDGVRAKREESEGMLDEDEAEAEAEVEGDVDDTAAGNAEGSEAGNETGGEGADLSSLVRPRGRPRGKGRSAALVVPSRARGRARGKGRGRGRGRSSAARGSREDADGEGEGDEGGEEDGRPWRRVGDKVCYIEGDEFVTESDEKGDQKIDIDGNLLGGRRFKCSTFILPGRHPTRQYMLAIDAARSSGFRDSLYYFRKNPLALKLGATQPEKEFLIQAGKLGAHLKTRSVTLVTARSAYKLHGAKMIIDGCWVTDDYYEDRALQDVTSKGILPGSPVGELPDPTAASSSNLPFNSMPTQTSGVSHGIYRAGGPTTLFGGAGLGPFSDGPHSAVRKSMLAREGLTAENWLWETARRVSEMNEDFSNMRRSAGLVSRGILDSSTKGKEKEREQGANATDPTKDGTSDNKQKTAKWHVPLEVYEPHTGIIYHRTDTQPTRCRWEQVAPGRVLGGTKVGNGAWALAWVDTWLELPGLREFDPGSK